MERYALILIRSFKKYLKKLAKIFLINLIIIAPKTKGKENPREIFLAASKHYIMRKKKTKKNFKAFQLNQLYINRFYGKKVKKNIDH